MSTEAAFCTTLAQAVSELRAYASSHRMKIPTSISEAAVAGSSPKMMAYTRWFDHEGVRYKAALTYFSGGPKEMHLLSLFPTASDLTIDPEVAQEMANAFLPQNFPIPEEWVIPVPGNPRPCKFGWTLK